MPFFGWALWVLRMVPIDRKNGVEAFEQVKTMAGQRMKEGAWMMFFPEGTRVPVGYKRRYKTGGTRLAVAVPWGDVSTAFHSTGIPNITVFVPATRLSVMGMRVGRALVPMMSWAWVQRVLNAVVGATVKGPDESARAGMPAFVWGEAVNARGERRTARVKTVNGYSLTVPGALAVVQHALTHEVPAGFTTPSRLMGATMLEGLPGGGPIVIT